MAVPGTPGEGTPGSHDRPRGSTEPRETAVIRIVIVDDHALVREGSVQLLEAEPDLEVVGVAGTGEKGLELLERLVPDLALVDVSLPGISGVEVAREVADRRLPVRVLMLTAYDDYAYVTAALDAGVGGYLLKTASARELVEAIRVVAGGAFVVDGAVSSRLGRRRPETETGTAPPGPAALGALTPRERDVLGLLTVGSSNKEIAARLSLGVRTVESYVSSILMKIGATSRTQAVAYALRHGLVPLDEDDLGPR